MSDIALRVEHLSKRYHIGHAQKRHDTLRDWLVDTAAAPFRRNGQHAEDDTFWALKDVSFEVQRGEVVGIIGRNGAGKSTLLKILSRITDPTEGKATINGRVGSLLEVGTGFHPELTGRENIYLNGAILGMKRAEIDRKFDEIVAFAEIEKFLDTPVKRYSSGMYVRLAFAVAAHLEPEILLVDEVLAVGDAAFQKKCLGKMGDVAKEGRTVLFVSHNMAAIAQLCPLALVLRDGQMAFSGASAVAVREYGLATTEWRRRNDGNLDVFRPSWARKLIRSVRILDADGEERNHFPMGSDITIELSFKASDGKPLLAPVMGVTITHTLHGVVGGVNTRMTNFHTESEGCRAATFRCRLARVPLLQGEYTVEVWLGDGRVDVDAVLGYGSFVVDETDVYGTGHVPFVHLGVLYWEPRWEFIPMQVQQSGVEPLPAQRSSTRLRNERVDEP